MLANRFGHFEPSGRGFVVTDPQTPMPWVNVICNGRYGLVVSQNGGGFSWFDDAQHNVLTRWEMDLVRDCYGKFLYIADRDTGETWSAAPAPCGTRHDRYQCSHTLGSTTFRTVHKGIGVQWALTVDPKDAVELWGVEVTNTTDKPRRLRVSSFFEWTCGVAPDSKREFHRLFFTTRHDPARRAILATKNMWDVRPKSEREHWNKPWPYFAGHAVTCPDFERPIAIADKATFLGRYGSTAAPKAMHGEAIASGGFGRFGDAAAALGGDLTLLPGQTVKLHYLLCIAENEAGVLALIDKHGGAGSAERALAAADKAWERRLAPTSVESERSDFDLLNNYWLPYQAISGRLWGRTGYYQQSGAFGFRDQLQDSQVWLPLDPAGTARQIMLHAERQFKDGSVYHWWHALADFGNHTACSDDYLWLPFVVGNSIKETGDYAILSRTAPFVDDPDHATILEHCRRAFARAFARHSPRGLPHIGSCDWNDGLSAMGVGEKGESVWLGMFLAGLLKEWATILSRIGEDAQSADFDRRRDALTASINQHAWEAQPTGTGAGASNGGGTRGWYRYGTKDSGEWVGAASCAEGKVHLNAQTWAILTGIAPPERAKAAWATVKEHLLSPYGPLLLWPAYTTPDIDLGYITRYCPGSRENGGVYMHAATWALMAACAQHDTASVSKIWNSISPPWRGREAEGYWAEPYVTPGNVDGPLSDKPGRAGWTWYTGSAAWLNRVCLEWVLGIRPTWGEGKEGGLTIDPCPPAELGKVSVRRTWRGVPVRVRFDAAEFVPGVRPTLTVSCGGGAETVIDGNTLPASMLKPAGLDVVVRWGKSPALGEAKAAGVARPTGA